MAVGEYNREYDIRGETYRVYFDGERSDVEMPCHRCGGFNKNEFFPKKRETSIFKITAVESIYNVETQENVPFKSTLSKTIVHRLRSEVERPECSNCMDQDLEGFLPEPDPEPTRLSESDIERLEKAELLRQPDPDQTWSDKIANQE
ncbi:MAG: hypothetical protein Q8P32_05005 [Candidatus Komeilibacteria bacterium]|nr:hypothetical protein [Candidatus Komeilibacteria bacterium]